MQKAKLLVFTFLLSVSLFSCGNDHEEVSGSQFVNEILPTVEVHKVEIENNEKIIIFTNENRSYVVEDFSPDSLDGLLDELESENENIYVLYTTGSSSISNNILMFQFFTLLIPFLILSHIILLWISLRKIIKSETDSMEKIVYTMISIFFPFFGSIIYLTTKKNRS